MSKMNPTVVTLFATVVVGNATPDATNEAPQVIARAVPLSLIRKVRRSKFAGVPVRFELMDVMAVASAVIVTASHVSVLIVGVADEARLVTAKLRAPDAPCGPVEP